MLQLPLIDLSLASKSEIESACRDVGFMYVVGHGIPDRTVKNARDAVINYFSQPLAQKCGDAISRDNYRGYVPQGLFSPAGEETPADNYEAYKLHHEVAAGHPICTECDLYGPNKWPAIAGFKGAVLEYWRECDRIALILLGILADILGVSKTRFLQMFDMPLTNMTLLHYPPVDSNSDVIGIHPHKDTDALTILVPDPIGGLMVKSRDGDEWLEAAPYADALIINIGDLLELWSGGYFVSTPHKVVNTSGADRYSFPYFAVPRFDTIVKPLRKPPPGFQRGAVHVGDVSREVWRMNWPDTVPDKPQFDLGTLED
ncbi:MAG: isopenicillin N synthase family dioxygenase [Woeseiaceae bacterium]